MPSEFYSDVAVPAAWSPLSVTSAMFQGTIAAAAGNTAVVKVRGHKLNTVNSTLDGSKFEYLNHMAIPVDLNHIEVQSSDGSTTQVLKICGVQLP